MSQLIIGLEGHDGTGKSSTAIAIANLLGGRVFFSDQETKSLRKQVYESESLSRAEKMAAIEKIYLQETERFETEMKDADIVVLDRTFLSHSVEENVRDKLDFDKKATYSLKFIPEEVTRPDVIFQVIIPEQERNRRVVARGEKLSSRDTRLSEDEIYRNELEAERKKHGCITLRLRNRDPETCALRAVQTLLGLKQIIPITVKH